MYNNITLEKGLYNITGKSFTEALRDIDGDENYVGTELEGLDAFERQLKRFDIKVNGHDSDRVEKFFKTTQSAILFPEFVRRCIKAGMDQASVLRYIVAAETYTDGIDYHGITLADSDSASEVVTVSAGAALPVTTVSNDAATVSISKYGRQIQTVYEVLRKQRLDLFAVILKSVGAKISVNINKAAAAELANGVKASDTASSGALTYSDLASFWAGMANHNMNCLITSPETMAKILAMTEMSDCTADENGVVTTPFGAKLVKCDGVAADTVIGVDRNSALEAIFGSDVIVDSDKLISNQIDSIAFSVSVGFAKIFTDAVAVLQVKKS